MVPKIVRNDFLVWLGLLGITVLSWIIFEGLDSRFAVYGIVFLSSLKVYLVGVFFMQVLKASTAIVKVFHIWIIGMTLIFWLFVDLYS